MDKFTISGIPSSFVVKQNKIVTDSGSGEAKLFVGSVSQENEFDELFAFNDIYKYCFLKDNLLEYINQLKMEYVYQVVNKYADVSLNVWTSNFDELHNYNDDSLCFTLRKFVSGNRYYIRSDDDIFSKYLRKIILPKITDITVCKDCDRKIVELYLSANFNVDKNKLDSNSSAVDENKLRFCEWLSHQENENGTIFTSKSVESYINCMNRLYSSFINIKKHSSIFEINSVVEILDYFEQLKDQPDFNDIDKSIGKRSGSNGIKQYIKYLRITDKPCNRIVFGAPGTGKSFLLKEEEIRFISNGWNVERVTFHPDYSYASFVGCYKPVPDKDDQGNKVITYKYVPGPFIRCLKKAYAHPNQNVLLIIEEINRANVAAVFGDVFQLLDREKNGESTYPINASEDLKDYLRTEYEDDEDKIHTDIKNKTQWLSKLIIPSNMYIWATMNSADQGVFPMDTAFKRRWEFEYIGINDGEEGIADYKYNIGKGDDAREVNWNELRKAINEQLIRFNVNEDKLMGPYFIKTDDLDKGTEDFIKVFKNKVIMYLFEDAAKQKRKSLFAECKDGLNTYSQICKEFDDKGVNIFKKETKIPDKFTEKPSNEGNDETVGDNGE